jgi:hypothetical protein
MRYPGSRSAVEDLAPPGDKHDFRSLAGQRHGACFSKALARRADDGLAASQTQIHVSSSEVAATAA